MHTLLPSYQPLLPSYHAASCGEEQTITYKHTLYKYVLAYTCAIYIHVYTSKIGSVLPPVICYNYHGCTIGLRQIFRNNFQAMQITRNNSGIIGGFCVRAHTRKVRRCSKCWFGLPWASPTAMEHYYFERWMPTATCKHWKPLECLIWSCWSDAEGYGRE